MSPDEMDAMAEAYFTTVCAADAEGLRALFADDLRWRIPKGAIPPYGGEHVGADRIVEMMLGASDFVSQLLGMFEGCLTPEEYELLNFG